MNLRRPALLALGLAAAAGPALAQAPAALPFVSSAEVEALVAKAERERKPGEANHTQPMLRLEPYTANLEYRTSVGPAAAHETEAELFYVIEGSGTLVTGGKLTGETRTNPENRRGSGIEGGATRKVGKGDIFLVPQDTPHWFSAIDGRLVMMSVHVPRR
jgi:mannose-6-phosphate isomerase-like protein (cupin superfamily)